MPTVPLFHVDPDLCTECEDCIKAMPDVFRKVEGEGVAEAFNVEVDESRRSLLDKVMAECPGHAILWKK
jgi:ferredoxin